MEGNLWGYMVVCAITACTMLTAIYCNCCCREEGELAPLVGEHDNNDL